MSDGCCFSIKSMIRGYHEYKYIWTDPTLGEELECKREPGNPHDTHAVAVIKTISGSNVTVGHLPRSISPICSIFIIRGGTITSRVNGTRRYSADIFRNTLLVDSSDGVTGGFLSGLKNLYIDIYQFHFQITYMVL